MGKKYIKEIISYMLVVVVTGVEITGGGVIVSVQLHAEILIGDLGILNLKVCAPMPIQNMKIKLLIKPE